MPEIKNTFTGAKMNKDFDERLVKPGEYRHAVNIQVLTTDSGGDGDSGGQGSTGVGDAGTVQNLKGNSLKAQTFVQAWMDNNVSAVSDINGNIIEGNTAMTPHCVGSIADEKNDRVYFLFASPPFVEATVFNNNDGTERVFVDTIIEYNAQSGDTIPVFVDVFARFALAADVLTDFSGSQYTASGWSEWNVDDATKYRPGMEVMLYTAAGVEVFNKPLKIKAIDLINGGPSGTILFHEAHYQNLSPSTSHFVSFRAPNVLNFSITKDIGKKTFITGINVIDDFLIWTDNRTEPKKISISRSKAGTNINGTNNLTTHTKLFVRDPMSQSSDEFVDVNTLANPLDNGGNNNGSGWDTYVKEEHITVIKKAPTYAPTLEMKDEDRAAENQIEISGFQFLEQGGVDSLNVGSVLRITHDGFTTTNFRPNDILIFTYIGGDISGVRLKATFVCYEDSEQEETTNVTDTIRISMVSGHTLLTSEMMDWEIVPEKRKPIYELKLGRFGYRYKYDDGEYSSFSPWSELAFLPSDFDYKISEAYNLGMVNTARSMILRDFIPYKIPLDVSSVDVLYKPTDSANVYVVSTVTRGTSIEWEHFTPNGETSTEIKTGELTITAEMVHRVLPENQTMRSWDNVPRRALSQEITGNRLLFANYTQGYNILEKINLSQKVISSPIEISETSQPPHKSIKSIRDYKIGVVYGDKYGRETPVLTPTYTFTYGDENDYESDLENYNTATGDITVEKTLCAHQNSLVVKQDWDNDPNSWIDYVKYYVKETSNEYYNLVMDRWYDSGDDTVWLSFNSADRNKVDEETYLILKNKHGNHEPVLEKARYKIIAIENEAPDFIKTISAEIGTIGALDVLEDIGEPASNDFGVTENASLTLDVWSSGTPSTAPADGFVSGNDIQIGDTLWGAAFGVTSGMDAATLEKPFGREIKGSIYMRVTGISWKYNAGVGFNTNVYQRSTPWALLTNVNPSNGGFRVRWAQKFYQQADFYNFWLNAPSDGVVDNNGDDLDVADLVYTIEFQERIIENKPEFDGKFFVKINRDLTLNGSGALNYGANVEWIEDGNFNLNYISSTTYSQALNGTYSNVPAVFGVGNSAGDDTDSHSWFTGNNQYEYNHFWSMFSVLSGGDWSNPSGVPDDWFETAQLDNCGPGASWPWANTYEPDWGARLVGARPFNNYPRHDVSDLGPFQYGTCTSIGHEDNGGSADTTWFNPDYDTPGLPDDMEDDVTSMSDNWGYENEGWNNPDCSEEFNKLANTGLFGTCTWSANWSTAWFWAKYRGWQASLATTEFTTTGAGNNPDTGNNAFLDDAKARHLSWPSGNDGINPNFRANKAFEIGGAGLGTYGRMTISRIISKSGYEIHNGSHATAVINGLTNNLTFTSGNNGAFFQMGTSSITYKVVAVEQTIAKNYSIGMAGNWWVDDDVPEDYEFGNFLPDIVLESCKHCDIDDNPKPWNWIHDDAEGMDNFPSWQDYNVGNGLHNATTGTDGYQWDHAAGNCKRESFRIDFRRVNDSGSGWGQIMEVDDGTGTTVELGMDLESYDPRGDIHHDGRDSISIRFVKPTPIFFADESNQNELGAIWETEPKKDSDLDIYYEASSAIPVRLNENNIFNFAPIGSKVSVKRFQGNEIIDVPAPPDRNNIRVGNIHMTDPKSNEAVIAIISETSPDAVSLHNGPYDVDGGYDIGLGSNFVHIQAPNESNGIVGDILVFTHKDGTVTQAKVTSYYKAIDDSPSGDTFTNLPGDGGNYDIETGTEYLITNGPKAFQKTQSLFPTGYYGITTEVWNEPIKLPWFNCYAFGNGVESDRVRDDFNAPQIDNGVRVSTTFSGYGEENIGSGLIYSGIYNSTTQINNLNEFNMAEKITKELNPSYGSIQRLKSRDTDMVVFAEDKVLRLLANKDAVYNADGNPQLTATNRVLGTPVPYVGDYGISRNPESLAWDQFRLYFTDKQRGAVLRLSRDGLTPISNVGMRTWFRDKLPKYQNILGTFDVVAGEYNITLTSDNDSNVDSTLSFNEAGKGWVSFKSFIPDNGASVSGKYFTTKQEGIWEHHVNDASRNTFYQSYTNSRILLLLNEMPNSVKSFKNLSYDGSQARVNQFTGQLVVGYTGDLILDTEATVNNDAPNISNIIGSDTTMVSVTDNEYYNLAQKRGWYCSSFITNLEQGSVLEFKNKEDKYFGTISGLNLDYGLGTHMSIQTDQFSVQGVGMVSAVNYISDFDDCVPACPPEEGFQCVEGECVEVEQIVLGCMDTAASNYAGPGNTLGTGGTELTPVATVDDGSCLYNYTGCMDPMAPNYQVVFNETVDTPDGVVGSNWTSSCQPFCTDCDPYQYGCHGSNNVTAINYLAGNTTDGRCFWQGNEVPCPQVVVSDPELAGYNANAWENPDEVGMIDAYEVIEGFSCLYDQCEEGYYWNDFGCFGEGCCQEIIEGCLDQNYVGFNPVATVSCPDNNFDGVPDCCGNLINQISGCLDPVACNYMNVPNATINAVAGPYVCEYMSCMGCMDPTACNFDESATNECIGPYNTEAGTGTFGLATCCYYDCDDGDYIPGCLDISYTEYCGPETTQWEELGMANPCNIPCWAGGPCGQYEEDGSTFQLGDCETLVEDTILCEETSEQWADTMFGNQGESLQVEVVNSGEAGPCQYNIYLCNDPTAVEYPFPDLVLGPDWTVVHDSDLCTYSYGCTNPDACNYNENAVLDDLSCRPCIRGCTDPNAINYSPYHDIDEAGPNDYTDWGYAAYSWEYDGVCRYWNYGCMDPGSVNYVGPGNEIGSPPGEYVANTMVQWTPIDYQAQWWQTVNIHANIINSTDYINIDGVDGVTVPQNYGGNWDGSGFNSGYTQTLTWDDNGITPNVATLSEMMDFYFAPGRAQGWINTSTNWNVPPYAYFVTTSCETCGCQEYGTGSAYLKVQNVPTDWAGETDEEIGE